AVLRRDKVEHRIRFLALPDVVNPHQPLLIQGNDRGIRIYVDVACSGLETGMNRSAPRVVNRDELNSPRSVSHVPEIGMTAFEFGLSQGEPDSVMMKVIGRIVVCHNPARWSVDRMNVTAPLENRFYVGRRKLPLRLICKDLVTRGAHD